MNRITMTTETVAQAMQTGKTSDLFESPKPAKRKKRPYRRLRKSDVGPIVVRYKGTEYPVDRIDPAFHSDNRDRCYLMSRGDGGQWQAKWVERRKCYVRRDD